MPDLLLLDTDVVVADAWHRVVAPGGYEWWYFDAQDREGSVFVVATFHAGPAFHPEYLRRFALYQRKPTRHAPPLPMEYCAFHLGVYENGRRCGGFTAQYPESEFVASTSGCEVAIGPNKVTPEAGGLRVHVEGPADLSAQLTFQPRLAHPPAEQIYLSRHPSYSDHHFWVIANPLCQVDGQITLPSGRTIELSGLGYHDHAYGTGPLAMGLRRWIFGRVLQENGAIAFQITTPRELDGVEQAHLFMADSAAAGTVATPPITWGADRFTRWGLSYPSGMDMGRTLILREPRVLDSSAFGVRLEYNAFVDGEAATAFCRIVYPHRLSSRLLGWLIERSIKRR
jgi:carotenoid 1,2-hydratase